MRKTKRASYASPSRRKQVLILAPSVPSAHLSRSEKNIYEALASVSKDHEVLCVPEDKPLSARMDEAELAFRGVNIYAFPAITRGEVLNRLKTLSAISYSP
jgi:hypothetical protein